MDYRIADFLLRTEGIHNDIVGCVAVRRLADMLSRNSAVVGENSTMLTLVPPTWINDGVKKQSICNKNKRKERNG